MEFIIDDLKCVGILLIFFVVTVFAISVGDKLDEIDKKQECYEIYATDNVILKRCEKYFEMPQE